jgi:hypothetical protein
MQKRSLQPNESEEVIPAKLNAAEASRWGIKMTEDGFQSKTAAQIARQ